MSGSMTPDEFVARWCSQDEAAPLMPFAEQSVASLNVPDSVKQFLVSAGLPDSAAPYLCFGPETDGSIPNVSDQWHHPPEFARYRSIGFNSAGDPIALDEAMAGVVVCVAHDAPAEPMFVNSSVQALAACLLAYRYLVNEAIRRNGEDAIIDNNVPSDLIEDLERQFKEIDAAAVVDFSFWGYVLAGLRDGKWD